MNQKINTKLGVIIICISSITVGIFVWKYENIVEQEEIATRTNNLIQQINSLKERKNLYDTKSKTEEDLAQNKKKLSEEEIELIMDRNRDFPDVGVAPKKGQAIIYTTLRRYGSPCNKSGDMITIETCYIRNIDGSFNKRLFWGQGENSYSFLLDNYKKNITIYKSNSETGHFLVDFQGNTSKISKDQAYKAYTTNRDAYEILSPDKKYIARRSKLNIVEIENTETRERTNYNFNSEYKENKYVHINSWKSDSKSVYVASGIESYADPAELWRIDIGNPNPYRYNQFDGMVSPIAIYPEKNLAFVRDKEPSPLRGDTNNKTNIFEINLINGKKEKIVTEVNYTTAPFAFSGQRIFYQNCDPILISGNRGETCNISYFDYSDRKQHLFVDKIHYPMWTGYDHTRLNPKDDGIEYMIYNKEENDEVFITPTEKIKNSILGHKRPKTCNDWINGKEYIESVRLMYDFD